MSENQYPEHSRLKAVQHESNAIGMFLDWLTGERRVELMRYPTAEEIEAAEEDEDDSYTLSADRPIPFRLPGGFPEALLAEYFKIDLKKLEAEKVAMLNKLREIAEVRPA